MIIRKWFTLNKVTFTSDVTLVTKRKAIECVEFRRGVSLCLLVVPISLLSLELMFEERRFYEPSCGILALI